MNDKMYEFEAILKKDDNTSGTYVEFPYDVRAEFGKGRVYVDATFDGVLYKGSLVNMGVNNEDGSICYIIGVVKDIRTKIGKNAGDVIKVTIKEREKLD